MDKFDWLVDGKVKLLTDKIDCVYKYYFEETNSVYVGRTIEREKRHNRHVDDEDDAVAKHARENGFAVPPMEIIEDNLTIEEGLTQEDYWKNYYKDRGYNILNTAKTGVGSGSIGAIGCGKWPEEKVFEEARKYKTKKEFNEKSGAAYSAATRMGLLHKMDWFENGRLNHKKTSKPILQYTMDGQFIKEYPSAREAERQTGINFKNICGVCRGYQKSSHNFIFKYAS